MSLEGIEKEIYSLTRKKVKPRRSKRRGKKESPEIIWLKRLVLALFSIVVLIIVGAVIFIFGLRNGSADVELTIDLGTTSVERGVPLDLNINIINNTDAELQDAELTLNLGTGFVNLDFNGGAEIVRDAVGEISGRGIAKRNFKILPIAEAGSKEKITATLNYSIGRTSFEKRTVENIEIQEEPLKITIEKPDQVLGGSSFDLNIVYKNNSETDFNNLVLEATYPSSFDFVSADLPPDSLNNRWRLGTLRAGTGGNFKIRGVLVGGEEGHEFSVSMFIDILGNLYKIADTKEELAIAESPLSVQVSIRGGRNYVARIGDIIEYHVTYTNRSGIALKDVEIEARMIGDLFDFDTLQTDAKVGLSQILTWDKTNIPALALLEPGASGTLKALIALKNSFPIDRLNDKNFTLQFEANILSPTVPYYLDASRLTATSRLITKVAGLITVDAKTLYRDAGSGILNAGALPPRVGVPTQYTVHWIIKNQSTDVTNVIVRTTLPRGVRWTGIVKSNIDSVPLYNEDSQEVVWEIDKIIATKGILSQPVEAIFQIEGTPTADMVGLPQLLLNQTNLQATDDFTSLTLTASDSPQNTLLSDDPTVGLNQGLVIE